MLWLVGSPSKCLGRIKVSHKTKTYKHAFAGREEKTTTIVMTALAAESLIFLSKPSQGL